MKKNARKELLESMKKKENPLLKVSNKYKGVNTMTKNTMRRNQGR